MIGTATDTVDFEGHAKCTVKNLLLDSDLLALVWSEKKKGNVRDESRARSEVDFKRISKAWTA
jgi:hypothetical protein